MPTGEAATILAVGGDTYRGGGAAMSVCQFLSKCEMPVRLERMAPRTCRDYMKRYCLGKPGECARFMVATTIGQRAVPDAMLPNETDRAWRLTRQAI